MSDYPAKFYAADLDGFVGSIALTDGFSESEKFSMMSTNRFYAGTDLGGNDISAMVSTGPHLIAAFDTLELTFAIVAGVTLDEIAAGISRAKVRFNDPQLSINSGSRTFARVFPNPADEKLYFSSGGGMEKFHVSICDMTGKSVYQAFQSSAEGVVDVSSWPAGIYLIRFSDENGNQSLTFTISR
ncbi:hypothetical protein SDC9_97744 [bioreactor metagenome]|uniref:Secretion system C-terminal sorting domain-containing protein n=1 Tax=bioreactor metagenome TaxID=1076179 RepID=A0A645AE68_9ZZZZ